MSMFVDRFYSGVSLAELLDVRDFRNAEDIVVSACCTDYRRVRPGDLYVVRAKGSKSGQSQAVAAVERGASAVLTEHAFPIDSPQCVVPDSKAAFGKLCHALAGNPANSTNAVGVFGEFDTTPTQVLIASVLEANGHTPALFGKSGYTDGFNTCPPATPSIPMVATWLAETVANGCSHAIVDLSTQPVTDRGFEGIRFKTLVLTGFATQTHRNTATPRVARQLQQVFEQLHDDCLIIANTDCPIVREATKSLPNPMLSVSMTGQAQVTANVIESYPSEQTFLLEAGIDTAVVRTNTVGRPYVQSVLLAAATGLATGADLPTIIRGVETVQKVPGYLERVDCGQAFSVFADACQSPQALQRTLKTLRSVTRGKLICVFGQGECDSTTSATSATRGRMVERVADLGIITSDDPCDKQPLRCIHDILDGYVKPARAHVMPNRVRAIQFAMDHANEGDTILIAGPHNQFAHHRDADSNDENQFHHDADVARMWLYASDATAEPNPMS